MAKRLIDKIQFNTGKYVFDFRFNDAITVICGDSSIGKTLFYNKLMYEALSKNNEQFQFINFRDKANIDLLLSNFKSKVIIIDNADILIDGVLSSKIRKDKSNQYILMGRRVSRYRVGRDSITTIKENNHKFTLRYIFMPKE